MIEFRLNAQSQIIPFEDGQALCDFDDPRAQAEHWLKHQSLESGDVVVLLGAGASYHLDGLAQKVSRVIVIDSRAELLDFCGRGRSGGLNQVLESTPGDAPIEGKIEFCCLTEASELVDFLLKELSESDLAQMKVLEFTPSFGTNAALFDHLYGLLTGRSRYGMELHLALMSWTQRQNLPVSENQNHLFHFRQAAYWIDDEAQNGQQRLVFYATKELAR